MPSPHLLLSSEETKGANVVSTSPSTRMSWEKTSGHDADHRQKSLSLSHHLVVMFGPKYALHFTRVNFAMLTSARLSSGKSANSLDHRTRQRGSNEAGL